MGAPSTTPSPYPIQHAATTGHEEITQVSLLPIPCLSLEGAGCSTRISRASSRSGLVFCLYVVAGAPLIHVSPSLSHHPNTKRRVPSSRARPTIAPCVVALISRPSPATSASRARLRRAVARTQELPRLAQDPLHRRLHLPQPRVRLSRQH